MPGAYHESAAVIEPGLDAFSAAYARGKPQVVWTRLVADLETPVSAYMKLAHADVAGSCADTSGTPSSGPMSFLLESVEGGINRGRYSMIGLAPDLVFRANGQHAEVNRNPSAAPDAFAPLPGGTLEALRSLLAESAIELPSQLPPMATGVFGYMGYDTVRLVEHLPATPPDTLGVPDALLMRPTVMVIFDAVKVEMIVVTPVYPATAGSKKSAGAKVAVAAYEAACERLRGAMTALDDPVPHAAAMAAAQVSAPTPISNVTPDAFMRDVRKAKEYVAAGDAFQVVLSQRLEVARRDWSSIRTLGQRSQDATGARLFGALIGRPTREDTLPARRLDWHRPVERPRHEHSVDTRTPVRSGEWRRRHVAEGHGH